jgi:hypothetical protein
MNLFLDIYVFKNLRAAISLFLLLLSLFFAGIVHAQESDREAISQGELEQILAPIALYPDTILSHILVASTYPIEVVQAERWALQYPELQGQAAVEAAQENDWDPSVQALVAFPQILKRLSQDLQWTQRLGDAFLQNEEQVLASVQNLRELAEQAGSLDEMEKVTVSRDERIIIIEPREREIVYVPYYDTRVVYGSWRWPHYQPTYWDYPYTNGLYYNDYYAHNRGNSFFWGPRISLSFGFFSNSFNWRHHHLVRISPRYYQPNRYHSHYDILGHRYAERWVHNSNRRHGNRSYRNARRNGVSGGNQRVGHTNSRMQSNQERRELSQERVRDQLLNRRNGAGNTGSARRVITQRTPIVTNRNTLSNRNNSVHRNTTVNRTAAVNRSTTANRNTAGVARPTVNSRINTPRRSREIEGNQRIVNRQSTRPVNRQSNQAGKATTAPVQQRRDSRPVRQQVVKRQTVKPRAAAAERKSVSAKSEPAKRNERRQPR